MLRFKSAATLAAMAMIGLLAACGGTEAPIPDPDQQIQPEGPVACNADQMLQDDNCVANTPVDPTICEGVMPANGCWQAIHLVSSQGTMLVRSRVELNRCVTRRYDREGIEFGSFVGEQFPLVEEQEVATVTMTMMTLHDEKVIRIKLTYKPQGGTSFIYRPSTGCAVPNGG